MRRKASAMAVGSVLTLGVLTLGAAVFSVVSSPKLVLHKTSPTPKHPWVPLPVPATPSGWVPVAFGPLQISVPSSWFIVSPGAESCDSAPVPGVVLLDWGATSQWCPTALGTQSPLTTIVTLSRTDRLIQLPRRGSIVNGINLMENIASVTNATQNDRTSVPNGEGAYLAPREEIEVSISGPPAPDVLQTLSYSARANVVAPGSGPRVPSSWIRHSFAGVSFAVPPSWPTERPFEGQRCLGLGPEPAVTLESHQPPGGPCGGVDLHPVKPVDGIDVDAWSGSYFGEQCATRQQAGLHLCLDKSSLGSILFVKVTEPSGRTFRIQIGLAGDGRVARTVLASLSA